MGQGEIVYDSILQNKQKTKTYWEQLMMAAEMGSPPPPSNGGSCLSEKANSETSEPDFYDAESQNGFESTSENLNSLESGLIGPNMVEKVAKKLLEAVESRPSKRTSEESVIEREIKMQRERELALIREREAAVQKAGKTLTAHDPRIEAGLKERDQDSEDDWRRSRGPCKDEDPFNSIPTTDEGNYSEYGSEGKEDFSPEANNSRVMSPEVELGRIHQRTQSMDSMSSGHSSGSGSGSGLGSHLECTFVPVSAPANNGANSTVSAASPVPAVSTLTGSAPASRRRGITVKPLDEPEEHKISTFFRNERETPIEREIRLAKEREEELRREKNNNLNNIIKSNKILSNSSHSTTKNSNNFTSAQCNLTNSSNVEKELLIINLEENIDVQSKVNQLNNLTQNLKISDSKPLKIKKHLSKSTLNLSSPREVEKESPVPSPNNISTSSPHFKKFVACAPSQKRGIMKRFLESRGKLGSTFTLNSPTANPEPIKKFPTYYNNCNQTNVSIVTLSPNNKIYVKPNQSKEESCCVGTRPGYKSAEEKIQNELMEMRRREEELRRQRAFSLARSQPNLLSLIDGEEEVDTEKEERQEFLDRLPKMSKLRTALSNPNLLDFDDKPIQKKFQVKKKSALIEEWENRIQKNID